jgi:hypothetical protein
MAAPDEPVVPPATAEGANPEAIAPATAVGGVQPEQAPVPLPPPPEPAPASPAAFLRWRRVLDAALVVVVLLLAFELGFFPVRNSDLLFHRAVGRLVAEGNFGFGPDPFTFTAEGARWVDHSWLFGLFAYGMNRLGEWGDVALVGMKALLLAALAELMLRLGRVPGRGLWVPALCTGLALLAISPRALLQPVCLSYLFVGLTLYLLDAPRRRLAAAGPGAAVPAVNVRWLIPLICALWVNLDAWFLLGPVIVALYLLGGLLEGRRAPRGDAANVAAVLAASVVACLANPYHVHAFTLPDHLGLSPAGREVADSPFYAPLFMSPLQKGYFASDVSRSLAGLAYFPLAFLGLASFILTPGSWRNWRGTVWLGLLLLSAWHALAVPFFAVAAGPITALNLLAAAPGGAEDVPADPERRRRILGFRVLALLAALAALAGGWVGGLHAPLWGRESGTDSRRPGWWFDFDESLARAARQVGDWRQRKLVPEDAHWFNTLPAAANYLAWYAPGARAFMDYRLSLYPEGVARDYLAARESLAKLGRARSEAEAAEEPAGWAPVFAGRKVDFVLVAEGDLSRRPPTVLLPLLTRPEEWTPCHLYGSAAVFGWDKAGPRGAAAFAAIRYRPDRLAFGPEVERAPREPAKPAIEAEWWETLWQPEPTRSADSDDAFIHWWVFQANEARKAQQEQREYVGGLALASGGLFGPMVNGSAVRQLLSVYGVRRDPNPPADLYLAVRAARRAVKANPDDGRSWMLLGQTYWDLSRRTREAEPGFAGPAVREVRQAQTVAALAKAARLSPDLEPAHRLLAELFEPQFLDLSLLHREGQRRALAARGLENPRYAESLDQLIEQMRDKKKELEEQFELQAAGKPPLQRAQMALQYGLGEPALKAALDQLQQLKEGAANPAVVAPAMDLAVRLMIATGQIDSGPLDARQLVKKEGAAELLGHTQNPNQPVPPRMTADWYRVQMAAAAGDYADADATLDDLVKGIDQIRFGPDVTPKAASALMVEGLGHELLTRAADAGGVPSLTTRYLYLQRRLGKVELKVTTIQEGARAAVDLLRRQAVLGQQADLQAVRGWLALEAGDVAAARRELGAVTERAARPDSLLTYFRSRKMAETLLGWVDANAKP